MNLSSRAVRRIATAAAVACAAIVLPAAALASSSSPSHPATPRCTAAHTYVWLALSPNGALGTTYYPIEFSNIGSTKCVLYGYPGVSGLSKYRHQLGKPAGRITLSHHNVTLRPGQTAHAFLAIVTNGAIAGCHNATGAALKVYPPNQKGAQYVENFTFPACTNKVYMHVLPMMAGIGVP